MTGRRRNPRFLLSAPVDGSLRVREEVAVESWSGRELEVVSAVPGRRGEELTLELPEDGQGQVRVIVRESRPVVTSDGSIRYRLSMSLAESTSTPDEGRDQS